MFKILRFCYSKLDKEVLLTQRSIEVIKRRQLAAAKQQTPKSLPFLRLDIEAGEGCEGFRYKFSFDTNLKDEDFVIEDETPKENAKNQVKNSDSHKVLFAVAKQNIKMVVGSIVDHEDKMMRSAFFVKENPMAEISCSCKTSFSPKEEALK